MSLRSLRDNPNIKTEELAFLLFPSARHPKRALSRVLNSDQSLDKNQFHRLAVYLGQSLDSLFCGKDWSFYVREKAISFWYGAHLVTIDYSRNCGYLIIRDTEPVFLHVGANNTLTEIFKLIEKKLLNL